MTTPDRKVEMAEEKYLDVAARKPPEVDGLTDHDRKVLTRKILWKLDLWYVFRQPAAQIS